MEKLSRDNRYITHYFENSLVDVVIPDDLKQKMGNHKTLAEWFLYSKPKEKNKNRYTVAATF